MIFEVQNEGLLRERFNKVTHTFSKLKYAYISISGGWRLSFDEEVGFITNSSVQGIKGDQILEVISLEDFHKAITYSFTTNNSYLVRNS